MNEVIYDGRERVSQVGYFGDIYIRKIGPMAPGFIYEGHTHDIDHVTFLNSGKVRIRYRNEAKGEPFKSAVFVAPICFEIRKDVWHEFEVLEEATWSCIFAFRAKDLMVPFND